MSDKKLTHSFSSLKMFENCPKRYFHQRVEKSVVDPGGEASQHGERVHKMLEDNVKDQTPLPAPYKKYEPAVERIKAAPGQTYAELELVVNEKLRPTGWWEPDAWLRTKVDIAKINEDKAFIADWKTGKRRPDPFQLELYAAQLFVHYPEVEQITACFVWLPDEKTDKEVYHRTQLPALWGDILSRVRRIEQAQQTGIWPARPSGLCGWCPCKSFCEFSQARR